MSLLVTGGAGFIGASFVALRVREHPSEPVVVLDALTYAARPERLRDLPGATLVHGDGCDAARVRRTIDEHGVNRVVHLAAESRVDRSIADALPFVRTNVLGTATLLEEARRAGVRRFVHVSTDEVYGHLGLSDPPFTETSPLAPRSPYAASKAGAEHLVRAYAETYRFPALVTRGSNTYGPYQLPEKLVPRLVMRALRDEPLPLYGDGSNVRDWLHVDDHARAIDLVLERGEDGETYNVGGRAERSNLEMAHAVLDLLGKPRSLVRFVADRPGHDLRYALDDGKIEQTLGFSRSHTLERGLADVVRFLAEHPELLESRRDAEAGSLPGE